MHVHCWCFVEIEVSSFAPPHRPRVVLHQKPHIPTYIVTKKLHKNLFNWCSIEEWLFIHMVRLGLISWNLTLGQKTIFVRHLSALLSVSAKMKSVRSNFSSLAVWITHTHTKAVWNTSREGSAQQHTTQRKYKECRRAIIWPVSSWPTVRNTSKIVLNWVWRWIQNGKVSFMVGNYIIIACITESLVQTLKLLFSIDVVDENCDVNDLFSMRETRQWWAKNRSWY